MSKVKINSKVIKAAVEYYSDHNTSIRDVARKYNISYETVRQGILSLSPESMRKKGKSTPTPTGKLVAPVGTSIATTLAPKTTVTEPNYGSSKMYKKLSKIASKYKVTISVVVNDNVVVIK